MAVSKSPPGSTRPRRNPVRGSSSSRPNYRAMASGNDSRSSVPVVPAVRTLTAVTIVESSESEDSLSPSEISAWAHRVDELTDEHHREVTLARRTRATSNTGSDTLFDDSSPSSPPLNPSDCPTTVVNTEKFLVSRESSPATSPAVTTPPPGSSPQILPAGKHSLGPSNDAVSNSPLNATQLRRLESVPASSQRLPSVIHAVPPGVPSSRLDPLSPTGSRELLPPASLPNTSSTPSSSASHSSTPSSSLSQPSPSLEPARSCVPIAPLSSSLPSVVPGPVTQPP